MTIPRRDFEARLNWVVRYSTTLTTPSMVAIEGRDIEIADRLRQERTTVGLAYQPAAVSSASPSNTTTA
jgi:hypothetical protein